MARSARTAQLPVPPKHTVSNQSSSPQLLYRTGRCVPWPSASRIEATEAARIFLERDAVETSGRSKQQHLMCPRPENSLHPALTTHPYRAVPCPLNRVRCVWGLETTIETARPTCAAASGRCHAKCPEAVLSEVSRSDGSASMWSQAAQTCLLYRGDDGQSRLPNQTAVSARWKPIH